jgi:cold shock protein
MQVKVQKAIPTAEACLRSIRDEFLHGKAEDILRSLRSVVDSVETVSTKPIGPGRTAGTVVSVFHEKGYGFVQCEDGREVFFHRSSMLDREDWDFISVGQGLEFKMEQSAKGPRAVEVARR